MPLSGGSYCYTDPSEIDALRRFMGCDEGGDIVVSETDLSKKEELGVEGKKTNLRSPIEVTEDKGLGVTPSTKSLSLNIPELGDGKREISKVVEDNREKNYSRQIVSMEESVSHDNPRSEIKSLVVKNHNEAQIKVEELKDVETGEGSRERVSLSKREDLGTPNIQTVAVEKSVTTSSPQKEVIKILESSYQPPSTETYQVLPDTSGSEPKIEITPLKPEEKDLQDEKIVLSVDLDQKPETERIELEVSEVELQDKKIVLPIQKSKDPGINKVELDIPKTKLQDGKVTLSVESNNQNPETGRIDLEVPKTEVPVKEKVLLEIPEQVLQDNKKIELEVSEVVELQDKKISLSVGDSQNPGIDKVELEVPEEELSAGEVSKISEKEVDLDSLLDRIDLGIEEDKEGNIKRETLLVEKKEAGEVDRETLLPNQGNFNPSIDKVEMDRDEYTENDHWYIDSESFLESGLPYDSIVGTGDDKNPYKGLPQVWTTTMFATESQENEDTFINIANIPVKKNRMFDREEYQKAMAVVDKYQKAVEEATRLSQDVEMAGKIAAALSSYLSYGEDKAKEDPKKDYFNLKNYQARLGEIKRGMDIALKTKYKTGDYKLPDFDIDYSINPQNYLRWVAEKMLPIKDSDPTKGFINKSVLREKLLDETLSLLLVARDIAERKSKTNRERLPGDDFEWANDLMRGGLSPDTLVRQTSTILTPNSDYKAKAPINRPDPKNPTIGWQDGNELIVGAGNTDDASYMERKKDKLKNMFNFKENSKNFLRGGGAEKNEILFEDLYLKGDGINLTLTELCGKGAYEIGGEKEGGSVEELMKCLKESPYITTPGKFTTSQEGSFNIFTLDSNSYWEVILYPYVGADNNFFSFLPDFREINNFNKKMFGVTTGYNKWVPISGFELMKSKLGSKSINLFDGEINIPTSVEFTNELRLTVVDDMYKSWKMYFEKCMEVSVYNSESHYKDYYNAKPGTDVYNHLTAIDKRNICIAPYKNVTFVCGVYVMTPQYATIRKFELLVVLKDIGEEFVGDIDSGGTDLNVSFSIVGENPAGADEEKIKKLFDSNNNTNVMLDSTKSDHQKALDKNMPSHSPFLWKEQAKPIKPKK